MVLGMVFGGLYKLTGASRGFSFDPSLFYYVLLPPIVYAAGFSLDRRNFFKARVFWIPSLGPARPANRRHLSRLARTRSPLFLFTRAELLDHLHLCGAWHRGCVLCLRPRHVRVLCAGLGSPRGFGRRQLCAAVLNALRRVK